MDIIGKGKIDSTVSGESTTYTAIPLLEYTFKKWTYGGTDYTDNPIIIPNTVTSIPATFYYSILNFLKNAVGFELTDAQINAVLSRRDNTDGDTDINNLDSKIKDLLYADTLYFGSTLPSQYGSVQDSDGGWTHQEGASTITAADKKRFLETAKTIWDKYGDTLYLSPNSVKIDSLW